MSVHSDEPFNPSEPALIVTVGNTARRHRALRRPVVVLGRAHGCDIGLTAPDVSSVHCLIFRGPGGLHIRDCQSRSGTQVNGRAVQEALLRDGDTLQVGPFSFQVYIPAGSLELTPGPSTSVASSAILEMPGAPAQPPANGTNRLERLERARQRWARLGLKLRQRLADAREALNQQAREGQALTTQQAELDRQADYLRTRAREYEQRASKLEDAERALTAERARLGHDVEAREHRLRQAEEELTRRQSTLERDIEAQWAAWQRHQDEMEIARRQLGARESQIEEAGARVQDRERGIEGRRATLEAAQDVEPGALQEAAHRLEIRRRELDAYARHLWRQRRTLAKARRQPRKTRDEKPLAEERRRLQTRQRELEEVAREAELEFARERAQLARERADLDQLHDETRRELERVQREQGQLDRLLQPPNLNDELKEHRRLTGLDAA